MDLLVKPNEQAFADAFHQFCQKQIASRAHSADKIGTLPKENWQDLRDVGFLWLQYAHLIKSARSVEAVGAQTAEEIIPELHRATYQEMQAVSFVARAMCEEHLSQACASTFLSVGASSGLYGAPLVYFGNKAQQEKYLLPVVLGEKIGCFALTEPAAGSDAAAIQLRAKETADGFLLSGEKALITNAPIADFAIVVAVTNPADKYAGVSMFVVDLATTGITRTEPYQKTGLRASPTGGLVFADVLVPKENLVGHVGGGFMQAMQTLELGRLGMCHFSIGIAEAALASASQYSQERTAFGKPIARQQAVHFKIADMRVEIDGARLLARKVAWLKDRGEPAGELASIAKLFTSEMAVRVADAALQIHGGWGYTDLFPVERYWRDARLGPIGEGTSEIQRDLIARAMVHL